jgi:S1-C subfamily serine protease
MAKLKTSEEIITTEEAKTLPIKPARRGKMKFWFSFLGLLFICLVVCAAVIAVLWGTGHLQQRICQAVLPNSPIYNRINCSGIAPERNSKVQNETSPYPVIISDDKDQSASTSSFDVTKIYDKTVPSVVGVGIKSDQYASDEVIGTGFVVSENGLIATNQHVVSIEDANYFIKISGSDELVKVEKIYRDRVNDLAILKVNKTGLTPLVLGNSDNVKPGQNVVAIGNPLGQLSSTVTSGIISGINREVSIGGDSFLRTETNKFEDTLQTDAAINPGNSGGPLLNANAQVIGINFATVQGYDNLSFAIPVNYLRTRLDELNKFGGFKLPYIGIQYRTKLVQVGNEVFTGAEVVAVDPNGSAAGKLAKGDVIIIYNGQKLEDSSLFKLIQKSDIGKSVKMEVVGADGAKRTVEVNITEKGA